jgi:hypothetical protein
VIDAAAAEVMFIAWGEWSRGGGSGNPSVSVIGRCIIEGPGASHSTVSTGPQMPKVVEIVEACCLTMPKPLLKAVKHRYIGNEPDAVAAKKLHISLDIYQSRINQAAHYLTNYLTIY